MGDVDRFMAVLAEFVASKDESAVKMSLGPWIAVLNRLDDLLAADLARLSAAPMDTSDEAVGKAKERVGLMLDFTQTLMKKARQKAIYNSIDRLIQVLRLDDWTLVQKAVRVVIAMVERPINGRDESNAHKNDSLSEWLLYIAFGYSLKNNSKLTFAEVLRDHSLVCGSLHFQYYAKEQLGKDLPGISTIRLTELYKDGRSSETIARELATKHGVPEELYSSFWCKVRLAKTVTTEAIKEQVVIASLLAYAAFSKFW